MYQSISAVEAAWRKEQRVIMYLMIGICIGILVRMGIVTMQVKTTAIDVLIQMKLSDNLDETSDDSTDT